jgi:glycosyltransferase involved in cell wall biosynthesis
MYAPGLTAALKSELSSLDVVHIHLARDLVTLPAARAVRRAGVRLVAQPHGMIDRSTHPLAGVIDRWEVKASLENASSVLTLTEQEARDIREVAPGARTQPIANGVNTAGDAPPYTDRDGGVLFLARLHPRKRPMAFVGMANELLRRGVDADFLLAGPDEGEAAAVRERITASGSADRITWVGPVDPTDTDALMRRARVFVLPSVGEVFPMTVLEAFAAGTPVVTTSSLGIAEKCAYYGAAMITDGSVLELADAVERVLSSEDTRSQLREGAAKMLAKELDIDSVVDDLLTAYSGASPVLGDQ